MPALCVVIEGPPLALGEGLGGREVEENSSQKICPARHPQDTVSRGCRVSRGSQFGLKAVTKDRGARSGAKGLEPPLYAHPDAKSPGGGERLLLLSGMALSLLWVTGSEETV